MSGREPIMTALMALLTSGVSCSFTGATTVGQSTVTGITSTAGLFPGLPAAAGAATADKTMILSVDSPTQITLSNPATLTLAAASFATGFQTTGRRLIHWSVCAAQPALFLRNAGDEYPVRPTRMPPKIAMECEAWLYNKTRADGVPAVGLNYLIDAIETALKPAPLFEAQTLGGLVHRCWIEGKIEMHPGDMDSQAIAVIPIRILAPTLNGG